jgi:hypothetical protein
MNLEQLSREAAGCLPYKFYNDEWVVMRIPEMEGRIDSLLRGFCWLHESTEACTEIMVRVLWPAGWRVIGSKDLAEAHYPPAMVVGAWNIQRFEEYNNDPMLAFRVAVLLALICLKGKDGSAA